jgi:hypothetical protein
MATKFNETAWIQEPDATTRTEEDGDGRFFLISAEPADAIKFECNQASTI